MKTETEINWREGTIADCSIRPLTPFEDERGWLLELFRSDELTAGHRPEMAYVSLTRPGVARGPHEHTRQTDLFVFFDGLMRLYLWDARPGSESFGTYQTEEFGADRPASVLVPPGVVHGYRNVGESAALMINCPNQLYAGHGKSEAVDEIRHEDRAGSPFKIS